MNKGTDGRTEMTQPSGAFRDLRTILEISASQPYVWDAAGSSASEAYFKF